MSAAAPAMGSEPGGSTRERILEAAITLFSEGGFDGTSTRALGKASGANISTIAYHFGDKEGLYRAVLDRSYASMIALELPCHLPKDPEERIRALVTTVFWFARERSAEVRLMLRHVLEHGSLPADIRTRGTGRLLARLDSLREALDLPDLSQRRMELLSLNHLIIRYAISDLADVANLVGEAEPTAAVLCHLGDVAVQLLGAGDPG